MKYGTGAPAAEDAPLDLCPWRPRVSSKALGLSASWKHNLSFANSAIPFGLLEKIRPTGVPKEFK
jgi:hypothetical protein